MTPPLRAWSRVRYPLACLPACPLARLPVCPSARLPDCPSTRPLLQFPDLDVPELSSAAVLLESDVAFHRFSVHRPHAEFRGCNTLGPIRAPLLVLDDLLAIEPVLDVGPLGHESCGAPFPGRLHDAARRCVHTVDRPR